MTAAWSRRRGGIPHAGRSGGVRLRSEAGGARKGRGRHGVALARQGCERRGRRRRRVRVVAGRPGTDGRCWARRQGGQSRSCGGALSQDLVGARRKGERGRGVGEVVEHALLDVALCVCGARPVSARLTLPLSSCGTHRTCSRRSARRPCAQRRGRESRGYARMRRAAQSAGARGRQSSRPARR